MSSTSQVIYGNSRECDHRGLGISGWFGYFGEQIKAISSPFVIQAVLTLSFTNSAALRPVSQSQIEPLFPTFRSKPGEPLFRQIDKPVDPSEVYSPTSFIHSHAIAACRAIPVDLRRCSQSLEVCLTQPLCASYKRQDSVLERLTPLSIGFEASLPPNFQYCNHLLHCTVCAVALVR